MTDSPQNAAAQSAAAQNNAPHGDSPKTILIAGASGFIGTELVSQLRDNGHTVVKLVRHPAHAPDERMWDPEAGWLSSETINRADAVINFSGASISHLPWTLQYKKQILQSRVQATSTLAEAIAKAENPPQVFLSGSASGFYGDRPNELLTESADAGEGFLSKVVEAWERAAAPATYASRVVTFRTGLVLGEGGVLKILRLIAKAGLAGPLGSGEQHWPWISLHDEAAAIRHLLTSDLSGPVNVVGPEPRTAAEVMRVVADQAHRPYWLPAPAWAIKFALADAGRELLLADQNMSPQLLTADGFVFRDTTLESALGAATTTR